MLTQLLTSKLFMPPLRPGLVPRPRLVQRLSDGLHAKRKLTLVSAPAGFGKTTLVTDWLAQTALPAAWLSLDETDNDPARFLAYLAAAFGQVDKDIGAPLLGALQSPQLPPAETILTGLLNQIASRADPLILVLDDYHLVAEPSVLAVMHFMLDHQPPPLHLVLTTREDPDLPLARLRAQDRLTEIRAEDLRFTRGEAEVFLRDVMGLPLSAQDVAALDHRTEGWAVGLQLAGLSLQKQADRPSFIADFSGSNRHILDYLTGEVIRQQPEDVRAFLLQTAVLDRLSGPLCDALTGRTDGSTFLARLEAANLFLTPLDEERRWYRYHHLFSDLLRSQLARSQPELIPELHRRASRWHEENGYIPAAIDHALEDSDLTRAAHLIEQYGVPALYQGQVALVLSWLDRLPEAILETGPMLCVSKAWALALMHSSARRGEVERALLGADHALDQVQAGEALRSLVTGHVASIRAYTLQASAQGPEELERLIALAQEAQRRLPAGENGIRSVDDLIIGQSHLALANFEAADLAFREALEDGLSGGNLYAAIFGPIDLGSIALLFGRLREALQLCDTNIARFNHILAGRDFPPLGALYILKGTILLEYDRLAEAGRALTQGLDLIRWTGEYDAYCMGYTALARLDAIRGDWPGMLDCVKTLEGGWPECATYTQALSRRLSLQYLAGRTADGEDVVAWLAEAGIAIDRLPADAGDDLLRPTIFETYVSVGHVLARLTPGKLTAELNRALQRYFERLQKLARRHGLVLWLVELAIVRARLYQANGEIREAYAMIQAGLEIASRQGFFRIFVNEGEPMLALLQGIRSHLTDATLLAYADRLLEATRRECATSTAPRPAQEIAEGPLSERELEVLRCLAAGLTYTGIAERLIISLNTVRYHVKEIYGKLGVSSRAEALAWARERQLL